MSALARSCGLTLGLVTACLALAAGCAGRQQEAPRTAAPSKSQAAPNRTLAPPGVIVILTDQTGALLGAVHFPNPVPDPITLKKSDFVTPKSVDEVAPEKVFLSPGFQAVTIFAMGDPCHYVVQGGKAVVVGC